MKNDDLSIEIGKTYREFVVYADIFCNNPFTMSSNGLDNVFENIIDRSKRLRDKSKNINLTGEPYSKMFEKFRKKLYKVHGTFILIEGSIQRTSLSDESIAFMMDTLSSEIEAINKILE